MSKTEFWNQKPQVNPVTMLPVPIENRTTTVKVSKKGKFVRKEEHDSVVESSELMKEFGLSAKALVSLFKSIGEKPRYKGAITCYDSKSVSEIRESLKKQL
jgi:hypothetical protein